MILSQADLRKSVAGGDIAFTPALEENQWGEASVDLRLGFSFTVLNAIDGMTISVSKGLAGLGKAGFFTTKILKPEDEFGRPESFILKPRDFVLAMTYESIKVPRNRIALVEGRSTYARVGLSMHQTAPWIQPGWSGPIVLEMMNNGPLDIQLIPLVDRPCQLTFFELKTELPKDGIRIARRRRLPGPAASAEAFQKKETNLAGTRPLGCGFIHPPSESFCGRWLPCTGKRTRRPQHQNRA